MRKNLIPLLAIALVVAVLSTAVFYGLIADRLEPAKTAAASTGPAPTAMLVATRNIERGKLLESADVRLSEVSCPPGMACVKTVADALGRATLDPLVEGQMVAEGALSRPAGVIAPSSVIPMGMRAVTMHVADSAGVVQMVRAGDHVDIQIIAGRDANPGVLEIRSVMPSVEVLNVGPPEVGSPLTGRPVVTVLLSPADADRVSLADTVGRLRIVLRNRKDTGAPTKGLTASVQPVTPVPAPAANVTTPTATVMPRDVYFDVKWVSTKQPETLKALGGHTNDALQVLPVTGSFSKLESEGKVSVLAKGQVLTRDTGEVSLERDGAPGVRIRLEPRMRADGRLAVRVEPAVKAGGAERKVRSDLSFAPGQSFLVAGLDLPDGVFAVITPRVVERGHK